jgi:AcrR family transcriptional regulator
MGPVEPERLGAQGFFHHPLAGAVMEVIGAKGSEAATIEEICAVAGVDRSEFDALFPDKETAILRTFEAYIEDFEAFIAAAYNAAPRWPDSLRAAAYALTDWIGRHPLTPQFGMFQALEAEEMARVLLERVLRWCASLIDGGREVAPDPSSIPETASLIVVGSVAQIVSREGTRLAGAEDRIERFREIVPEMMYTAVRPYLGEEAAKRELTIPPPDLDTSVSDS